MGECSALNHTDVSPLQGSGSIMEEWAERIKEPEGGEICSKKKSSWRGIVFRLMDSLWLWWPTWDLDKAESINTSSLARERLMRPHHPWGIAVSSWLLGCVAGGSITFFSSIATNKLSLLWWTTSHLSRQGTVIKPSNPHTERRHNVRKACGKKGFSGRGWR